MDVKFVVNKLRSISEGILSSHCQRRRVNWSAYYIQSVINCCSPNVDISRNIERRIFVVYLYSKVQWITLWDYCCHSEARHRIKGLCSIL